MQIKALLGPSYSLSHAYLHRHFAYTYYLTSNSLKSLVQNYYPYFTDQATGSERLGGFLKLTQLVNNRGRIAIQMRLPLSFALGLRDQLYCHMP